MSARAAPRTRLALPAVLFAVVLLAFLPTARSQVARFALVAGNDRGQQRQSALRYAERDAQRFSEMLVDLGGFAPESVALLTGRSASEFRAALARINVQIESLVPAQIPRALLIVYFSGHSDGVNLEFGSDRLPFSELRRMVESSGAQIKIAFVDSCQSGGLTTVKGARAGPAFDLVLTDNIDATGTAIVTSSSVGENSQESEEVAGSFFTHYLLSGLRGAADQDQDRKVSLAEVYQYAYDKTVIETSRTLSGTQHPTYEYQIEGRGGVVLTDLSRGEAGLAFGPELGGQFLVLRKDALQVVAEMSKPYGSWRRLVLPSGDYQIAQHRNGRLVAQVVTLAQGSVVQVRDTAMRGRQPLLASLKGGTNGQSGLGIFLHYGLMSGALKDLGALHQGMVGLRVDLGPTSFFPRIAYGESSVEDGKLRYHMRMFSVESYLTWRVEHSVLDFFGGLSLGASFGAQKMANEKEFSGTLFSCGAVGGIDIPVLEGLALQVFWEAGAKLFRLNNKPSDHFFLQGVVGLGYEL